MESLFLLLFFALLFGLTVVYALIYGITPTPTSKKVKTTLFRLLPPMHQTKIVDLGSGWGNLVFALAEHYPDCQVTGYEISPLPYCISKWINLWRGLPNVTLKRQDFFEVPLSEFSLVICYLYPGAMLKLKEKFERELPNQAYVITHTFAIPGWIPLSIERANDIYQTPIYFYRMNRSDFRSPLSQIGTGAQKQVFSA
jgi:hypothetical protein